MSTNRSPEWRGISRIDYKHTHGWFARVYLKGKRVRSKLFSDNLYASREDALDKARAWRDQQYADLPPEDRPQKIRYMKRRGKNNTSGRVGISKTFTRSKKDENKKLWCYSVTWAPTPGKPRNRSFYYSIYGSEEAAFRAACEFRAEREREIAGIELTPKEQEAQRQHILDQFLAYFKEASATRAERLRRIHDLILEEFPDVTLWMKSTHPCYQRDRHWVTLFHRQRSISIQFHPVPNFPDFLSDHPTSQIYETCIHYRDTTEMRLEEIRALVRHTLTLPEPGDSQPAKPRTPVSKAETFIGKARITKAIKQYFLEVPKARQAMLWQLHGLILDAMPTVRLTIENGIPAYENDGAWVILNHQKQGIFVAVSHNAALAHFLKRHPAFDTGQAGLTITPATEVPEADFRELVLKVLTTAPDHEIGSDKSDDAKEPPVNAANAPKSEEPKPMARKVPKVITPQTVKPARPTPPKPEATPPKDTPTPVRNAIVQTGLPVLTVPNAVEVYLQSTPEPRQTRLRELHAMIVGAYPLLKQSTKFRSPTYEGATMWMTIGDRDDGIAVHVKNGRGIDAFVANHPELPHASNWFQLPDDVRLPRRDFKTLLATVFGDTETPASELRQRDDDGDQEAAREAAPAAPAPIRPPENAADAPAHEAMPQVMNYIMACPANRQTRLFVLHSYILSECPHVSMSMRDDRPTYDFGGRWVAIANTAEHVALYVDDSDSLTDFRAANPDIETGKARIAFGDGDAIPQAAIQMVIRKALAPPKPFGFDVA